MIARLTALFAGEKVEWDAALRKVVPRPDLPICADGPLIDRLRETVRARHLSPRTADAYAGWAARYLRELGRPPEEAGETEIGRFLSGLATASHVSASTQNQALSALLFLYAQVLGKKVGLVEGVVRAKRPERLPVVLSRDEVRAVLGQMSGAPRLMAMILYGAGLRLMECCQLRVKDVDFGQNQLVVRAGKGGKDRHTALPVAA